MSDSPKKTVRLPFEFGERVYHRLRGEDVPGMVTGFHIRVNNILIAVTWPDLQETSHYFYELTTEFQPDFSSET
jgi:hypothetical protein